MDFILPYRFRSCLLPKNASDGTIRFTLFPGLSLNFPFADNIEKVSLVFYIPSTNYPLLGGLDRELSGIN